MVLRTDDPSGSSEIEARQTADSGAVYAMIAGLWVGSTVRALAELGAVDVLLDGPRSATDVAAATGCDPVTMRRLLVACTSLGLLTEDERGRFAPTSRGELLGDTTPGSLRALARLQGAPGVWALWGALPEAVRQGTSQSSRLLGADYFPYLADHPDEAATFGQAMASLTGLVIDDARRIVDLGAARDVLDVGGGNGSFVLGLMAGNPRTRGRLLDRPAVAEQARLAADAAGMGDRFEALDGDFFVDVPGSDYYVLKLILHDWDDEQCRQILRNCRRSAHPNSRLLIIETLIGEGAADEGQVDLGAMMDMTILALLPGRERRLSEYDALLQDTGWARRQLARTRSIYSLIEAAPV